LKISTQLFLPLRAVHDNFIFTPFVFELRHGVKQTNWDNRQSVIGETRLTARYIGLQISLYWKTKKQRSYYIRYLFSPEREPVEKNAKRD